MILGCCSRRIGPFSTHHEQFRRANLSISQTLSNESETSLARITPALFRGWTNSSGVDNGLNVAPTAMLPDNISVSAPRGASTILT